MDKQPCISLVVSYGAFPLHGTARYGSVRFTFGGFSTGYSTWYLVHFLVSPRPRFLASLTITKTRQHKQHNVYTTDNIHKGINVCKRCSFQVWRSGSLQFSQGQPQESIIKAKYAYKQGIGEHLISADPQCMWKGIWTIADFETPSSLP